MSAGTETIVVEILVTGLPMSGKSTLMQTISQRTAYKNGDPQSWHSGYLNVDTGLDVHFIEPPAIEQFNFIELHELIAEAHVHGFMVLCDSSLPEFFGETVGILQSIRAYHPDTPCALIANKQDASHAWNATDIRMGLGIPEDILVLPTVAQNLNDVKLVVSEMLYRIFND